MVKLIQCVRRRPDVPLMEFRQVWEEYGERLRGLATALGAVRVSVSTTLEVEANRRLLTRRISLEPFDGLAEVWWPRAYEALEAAEEEEFSARIDELWRFQASFLEIETSSFFFTIESVLFDRRG